MELRDALPEDRAELDRLFTVAAECDGHFPIGEHKYLDLMAGGDNAIGAVAESDGEVVAYLAVTPPRSDGVTSLEIAVHPLHRSHEVISRLVEHGVRMAESTGGDRVRVWAFQPNMVDEYRAAGFKPERELRQLRIDLPIHATVGVPEGYVEDRFRPERDADAWLEVNNAAFWWHPENGSWTAEILADRMDQEWFDPEAFIVLRHGSDLAGFCWTKAHDDMGEIYVIAVSPDHQGRGLGRFLVVRGLEVIGDHLGFSEGMLYMDADNEPAARLYDTLGFQLHHVDRSLVRGL